MAEVDATNLKFPMMVSEVRVEVNLGDCKLAGVGEAQSSKDSPVLQSEACT
jgi:hypothetical protein